MNFGRFIRRMSKRVGRTTLRGGILYNGRAQINSGIDDLVRSLWPLKIELPLVRIGGSGDGGYLVPDDLDGVSACFSPGVADRANFELELAARGIRSFLLDGSIDECPVRHKLIEFEPKFLDGYSGPDRISINDWIEAKVGATDDDLLLQVDIEGYEWPSLLALENRHLERFRIIVLEVHNLEMVFQSFGFRIINAVLGRLLVHFDIVHTHPNNNAGIYRFDGRAVPDVMELTFYRKDRSHAAGLVTKLPHSLDEPCINNRPELSLYDALSPLPPELRTVSSD